MDIGPFVPLPDAATRNIPTVLTPPSTNPSRPAWWDLFLPDGSVRPERIVNVTWSGEVFKDQPHVNLTGPCIENINDQILELNPAWYEERGIKRGLEQHEQQDDHRDHDENETNTNDNVADDIDFEFLQEILTHLDNPDITPEDKETFTRYANILNTTTTTTTDTNTLDKRGSRRPIPLYVDLDESKWSPETFYGGSADYIDHRKPLPDLEPAPGVGGVGRNPLGDSFWCGTEDTERHCWRINYNALATTAGGYGMCTVHAPYGHCIRAACHRGCGIFICNMNEDDSPLMMPCRQVAWDADHMWYYCGGASTKKNRRVMYGAIHKVADELVPQRLIQVLPGQDDCKGDFL